VLEWRLASLRTQCTALLAVTAVILGIGATGLGALSGRHLKGGTVTTAIVVAVIAAVLLIVAAMILLSTIAINPPTRTSDNETKVLLRDPDPAVALAGYESELREICEATENDMKTLATRTKRGTWVLGVGIVTAVVLAAILTIVPTRPTKTELVSGSTVSVSSPQPTSTLLLPGSQVTVHSTTTGKR
jgi:ABC-type proline/glycine betaine transport system permease subunit